MTELQMQRLERLALRATPGPFAVGHRVNAPGGCYPVRSTHRGRIYAYTEDGKPKYNRHITDRYASSLDDALYMAAALEAVPALIAKVRRLRRRMRERRCDG